MALAKEPRWYKIGSDRIGTVSVDMNNHRRIDNTVYVWLLSSEKKDGSVTGWFHYEVKCIEDMMTLIEFTGTDKTGKPGNLVKVTKPAEGIIPGSLTDQFKEFVCSKF